MDHLAVATDQATIKNHFDRKHLLFKYWELYSRKENGILNFMQVS